MARAKKIKFKLDDDVPLPLSEKKLEEEVDWAAWAIGQSKFFPGEGYAVKKIAMAARAWGKKNGRSFTAQTRREENIPGVRVWRAS